MKTKHCLLYLMLCILGLSLNARTWTDEQGRQIEGKLIRQSESTVTLQLKHSIQQTTFEKSLLSSEDLSYLNTLAKRDRYAELIEQLPTSTAQIRSKLRGNDTVGIAIWQNQADPQEFHDYLVELIDSPSIQAILRDRAFVTVIDDDASVVAKQKQHFPDSKHPVIFTLYSAPSTYSSSRGISLTEDIEELVAQIDESIYYCEDHFLYPVDGRPNWPTAITGEVDTLFETAAVASKHKLPFILIYANGTPADEFTRLKSETAARVSELAGNDYIITFVLEDSELKRRNANGYRWRGKALSITHYSKGYQARSGSIVSTKNNQTLAQALIKDLESTIRRDKELRKNLDPNDPFQ